MDKYATAIEGAGLVTFADGVHLRVSRRPGLGLRRGGQMAVLRVDAKGSFEWGWVEHADGGGRDDFWEWAAWWKALRKVKAA